MLHSFVLGLPQTGSLQQKGRTQLCIFPTMCSSPIHWKKKLIQEKKQKQPTMLLQVPTIKKHSSQHQIYGKTSHLLAQ